MAALPGTMNAGEVLDAYFLEMRAKIIEIAASLDRVDRAGAAHRVQDDERRAFIDQALGILQSKEPGRAQRILDLYSL